MRCLQFCFIFTTLLCNGIVGLNGQSRSQLEAKRKKVQEDISYTKQILEKTRQKKNAALHNLSAINRIIDQRVEVIGDLKDEISEAESEIQLKKQRLESLKAEYQNEKIRLHKTIVKAYKTRKNANEMAFVFASASFRKALKRLKYLKKLSEYRSYLIARIVEKRDSVNSGLEAVETGKKIKTSLLADEESEKENLEKDKTEKKKLVTTLSSEEKQLRKKIRNNELAIAKLNSAISRMIANEIAEARRRAAKNNATASVSKSKKQASSGNTNSGQITLTPEARELSNSFVASMGLLPWPVERGYISQGFGVHPHPDLAGISLQNNGVDITTSEGQNARAVFKGTVSAIINIPGQEKAVLVNHGEYYTVYSRLSTVYVGRGDIVQPKQNIGQIWTDDDGKTILQFQVWKGQSKQNPAFWIVQR